MVGLSVPELVLIGAIALVVFGPSKLPEVGSAVGKTIREFKKSMQEPEPEPKKEMLPVQAEQGVQQAPAAEKPKGSET